MPIYEYKCNQCPAKVQRLEKIDEDSSGETCPVCGRGELKKVLSLFGTPGFGGADSCIAEPSGGFS